MTHVDQLAKLYADFLDLTESHTEELDLIGEDPHLRDSVALIRDGLSATGIAIRGALTQAMLG